MWYVLIVIVIGVSIGGYIVRQRVNKAAWYNSDHHDYDLDKLNRMLSTFSKHFTYHGDASPYGRANGFFKTFNEDDKRVDYFGYEPVSSKVLEEFKEYGVLLTSEGILFKKQGENEEPAKEFFVDFNGLYQVKNFSFYLKIYYHNSSSITLKMSEYTSEGNERLTNQALKVVLQQLIASGYTRDLLKGDTYLEENVSLVDESQIKAFERVSPEEWFASQRETERQSGLDELDEEVEESVRKGRIRRGVETGVIAANSLRLAVSSRSSNLISQVRNPSGGGFAAEVYNDVQDKLQFKRADIVGGNNAKNGADRIVNGVEIQTKYYRNANQTVNSAFDSNGYRYMSESGKPMQQEVPADQYVQAMEFMREKIVRGEVPGLSDPKDAYQLIRKGHATYDQAQLMTQAFNATSITHDLKSGLIQSTSPAGISVLIVFAHAKWSGATTEDAFKLAAKVGLVHVAIGTVMHATTAQLTKAALSSQLNTLLGGSLNKTIVNGVPVVVTSLVIYGWETIEFSTGRLSKNQYKKNVMVKTAGVGGAMIGASLPFFGPTVGAIGLGTVTYIGAQKVADLIYKGDREIHYPTLKEEFIDLIYSIKLADYEIEEIKQAIFIKKLSRHVKSMQKQVKQNENTHSFARNEIIMPEIKKVFSKRDKITREDIKLVDGYFKEVLGM